jgi:molybdenum cofactor guanylyltransferase
VDKASLRLGGRTFLQRALDAVSAASVIVVVGPQEFAGEGVHVTQEDPPGGGPVAGIAAGLERVSAKLVVVLAVDYPLVDAAVVADLIDSLGEADGCVLSDEGGRDQPLAGCFRARRLRAAIEESPSVTGASVQEAMRSLHIDSIRRIPAAIDCDTPDDLERLTQVANDGRT